MNCGDQMWERIFENFDSIVISAEGAGEATEEGEELVDTEAAGAVRHDVLVGEKECQHQLPLLGLCQQAEVDMFSGRKWMIVSRRDELIERSQYLFDPGEIVENEAGAPTAVLQLHRLANVGGKEGKLDVRLNKGGQSGLRLLL